MALVAEETRVLERHWFTPPGVTGWLTAVNHRAIGVRFIVTAFVFFLLAGIQAMLMRVQLAQPDLNVLSPERFNQFFTMHGTTMMFLFAVPMMEGLGMYLVPLMIGCRDMAFPRLSAFGYWVYLFAGVGLYVSLFAGVAPNGGWFAYVPLTRKEFSPGVNLDLWATLITFLEFSALTAAVELIVTIFKFRVPGMAINRLPLFVWSILVMAFMIVFAMPPLMVASVLLELDRAVGTHFYNPLAGGDPLLWQHLFWFFGHPEVYIILLPALGIVSAIVATFTRTPVVGYTAVVLSTVAIGILSFGLWVHHMFATGIAMIGLTFFAAASMMIAIPSGVQVFAWLATMLRGRIILQTPMLFVLGFVIIFVLGGVTGVMVAAVPFDLQVHDSYFVVAHFHYVLFGGTVFPLLGGLHYWFPKITGRLPSERLGRWSFWLIFIGFNVTFFGMHLLGLLGMPRRIYTYPAGLGWDGLNLVSTVGAALTALGLLVYVTNYGYCSRRGDPAPDDPWGGGTLEWSIASPPPSYNFQVFPEVRSRHPLWDQAREDGAHGPAWPAEKALKLPDDRRETLSSTVLDARPEARIALPGPTVWPLMLAMAVGVAFAGAIVHVSLVLVGALLSVVALIGWHWPRDEEDSA